MMMSRLLYLALLISFITACNKESCDVTIFDLNTFEVNKTYCLDEEKTLTIRLIEDSRCPSNVVCVHAGWVELGLEWNYDGSTKTDSIIISPDGIASFDELSPDQDISLTANSVDPYPATTEPIPDGDYILKFIFKK